MSHVLKSITKWCVAIGVLTTATTTFAVNTFNVASGDFNTTTNWGGSALPGNNPSTNNNIIQGGNDATTSANHIAADYDAFLIIRSNTADPSTLTINHNLNLDGAGGGSSLFLLGFNDGFWGTVTHTAGTLTAGTVQIGDSNGGATPPDTSRYFLTGGTINAITGGIQVLDTGELHFGNGGSTGSTANNIGLNGGDLIFNSTSDLTLSGLISGTGEVWKLNSGILTLDTFNNYSGTTQIGRLSDGTDGGTLRITANNALGTGTVTFQQGGTLEFGANGVTIGNFINWLNWGGSNPRKLLLDLPGTNSAVKQGGMEIRNSGQNIFEVGADDTLTIQGAMQNTHVSHIESGIIKNGNGTLLLEGANTYRGSTVINAGTIEMNGTHNPTLANNPWQVNSGGTLAGDGSISNPVNINNGGFLRPGVAGGLAQGTLTLTDNLNITGAVGPTASASMIFDVGQTFDQVSMASSTLTIGAGLLEFDDFVFNNTFMQENITITLFDVGTLSGSLGANLTGLIAGYEAELALDGQDIVLNIGRLIYAPEPSTVMLLGVGGFMLYRLRRRKSVAAGS